MTHHVTPKRMKGNQVFLPTLGTITIPCGISLNMNRGKASPSIAIYNDKGKVVRTITVSNPTAEGWLRNIKLAVQQLREVRSTLLCRRLLKAKVKYGPIPGCGQPGVYAGGNYSTPMAADPLERSLIYTHSLSNAVRLREAAEERYYEHWAFDESKLIPTPI